MKERNEVEAAYLRNCRTIWNTCYPYFMNSPDTEDAVQETFVRYACCAKQFRDFDHEKAWLIVTARNVCKDELKRHRRKELPLESAEALPVNSPEGELLCIVQQLPEKQRNVVYLYYYEGYSTNQLAKMFDKPEATIRSWLHRGRQRLKEQLGGDMR